MNLRAGVFILAVVAVITGWWLLGDGQRSADTTKQPAAEPGDMGTEPQREQVVSELKQMRLDDVEQREKVEAAAAENARVNEQARRPLRVSPHRQPGWRPERGSIVTVSGTVVSLGSLAPAEEGEEAESGHLRIDTGSEVINVKLGPARYLQDQNVQLEIADEIMVTGLRKTARGAPLIVASSITKDGDTLTLRADDGKPAWRLSLDERRAQRDERRRRQGVRLPGSARVEQVSSR